MEKNDFDFFKSFLMTNIGMAINEEKIYLLESRLSPILKQWMFGDLKELANALRYTSDQKLMTQVLDAMTTNETLFFRDERPFQYFKNEILPKIVEKNRSKKTLRIWSAACSSGQEAFSIAICLRESLPDISSWKIDILGTDISQSILSQAKEGNFSQFEIQRGLPIQYIMKYFSQSAGRWKINDEIQNMVEFRNFNLLDNIVPFGVFDVIFCRNVLIYFDETTKLQVIKSITKNLAADGFLFLGGTESCNALGYVIDNNCPGLIKKLV